MSDSSAAAVGWAAGAAPLGASAAAAAAAALPLPALRRGVFFIRVMVAPLVQVPPGS